MSAGLLMRADVGRGRSAAYSLTEAAIELVPLLALLGEWGLRNRATTPIQVPDLGGPRQHRPFPSHTGMARHDDVDGVLEVGIELGPGGGSAVSARAASSSAWRRRQGVSPLHA